MNTKPDFDYVWRNTEPYLKNKACRLFPPVEWDDAIQVARIAVWRAVERYDPTRGVKATTYAISCAEGAMRQYWRDHQSLIRIPGIKRQARFPSDTPVPLDDIVEVAAPAPDTVTGLDLVKQLSSLLDLRSIRMLALLADGYTTAETGRRLGVSSQFVSVLRRQARERIAEGLPELAHSRQCLSVQKPVRRDLAGAAGCPVAAPPSG